MKTMHGRHGFSLIELLTVIAIIAILAAIIFPVMGRVKQEARLTSCMTNLMQIAQAVKMYHMDNRKYPLMLAEVQFANGTGGPVIPLERTKSSISLYPEYVKTIKALHCGRSTIQKTDQVWTVTTLDPKEPNLRYAFSSYDAFAANPTDTTADLRYTTNWADVAPGGTGGSKPVTAFEKDPSQSGDPVDLQMYDYKRQLKFRNPSDDTLVTWCSLHANGDPSSMIPVVYLDGHAEKRPMRDVEGDGSSGSLGSRYRLHPKTDS